MSRHVYGVVLSVGSDHVAGQRGNCEQERVDLVQRDLFSLTQRINHGHAALGIGVSHTYSHIGASRNYFISNVALY